jgi:hypothetical protein
MYIALEVLGYAVIVAGLVGIVYTCYKIVRSEFKDMSENDD